jgi:hypothetical protein
VGAVLSAGGLALIVFGVLQASNWGWLRPLNSPVEPFGFSLTPFVIAAGGFVLAGFRAWERHRESRQLPPLLHFRLLGIPTLRSGVSMFLAQNLVLMGAFFTIPLFLQIVQGLDALETGVGMLPASAGLFFTALAGRPSPLASPPGHWCERGWRSPSWPSCCCSTRSSRNSTTPPSWSRWGSWASGWG